MIFFLGLLLCGSIVSLTQGLAENQENKTSFVDHNLNLRTTDESGPSRVARQNVVNCRDFKRQGIFAERNLRYMPAINRINNGNFIPRGINGPMGFRGRRSVEDEEDQVSNTNGSLHQNEKRMAEGSQVYLDLSQSLYSSQGYEQQDPPTYYEKPKKVVVFPGHGQAPPDQVQPGQPGGGMYPKANPYAASLAPRGTVPVAVFPPYAGYQRYPAVCVIFTEPSPYDPEEPTDSYGVPLPSDHVSNEALNNVPTSSYETPEEVVYVERLYGYTCQATIGEGTCQIGLDCDMYGNEPQYEPIYSSPPQYDDEHIRLPRQGIRGPIIGGMYSTTVTRQSTSGICR